MSVPAECDLPLCFQRLLIRANNVQREAQRLRVTLTSVNNSQNQELALLPVVGNMAVNSNAWEFAFGNNGEIHQFGSLVMIPLSITRGDGAQVPTIATIPAGLRPPGNMQYALRMVAPGPVNIGPVVLNIVSATGVISLLFPGAPPVIPTDTEFSITLSYVN